MLSLLTLSSSGRKTHAIQETPSCPGWHLLLTIFPSLDGRKQNFDDHGNSYSNRLWRISECFYENTIMLILFPPSVLFRILSSLPPHPALTSALPKCLCPLGCASSPAISQLTNQAAGQPEWDQRGGDASVLGAWVTGCFISVVTKGCVGTGGGTSAQFNVFSSTHFIRGWWWKGKDSSILMCIFKSITETVN